MTLSHPLYSTLRQHSVRRPDRCQYGVRKGPRTAEHRTSPHLPSTANTPSLDRRSRSINLGLPRRLFAEQCGNFTKCVWR
ncbi:hypothetical protein CC2G_013390 [Coprinopsis cinerea AmutBmut pab1-1]|nr:hypothetical protein CC2G_013390 [Coprinopsis cinerea AmutBmut pab1-1]